ncbi:uncharacterized protein G2W53_020345 [Senna tora]|uniref:Uncharacterized protein n=1 Tax=Senna tora TaxID=362788 RepID=A0A834TZJ7_9FABA|nr:uncharacterized protein G2W53_020345 [Senna tora]
MWEEQVGIIVRAQKKCEVTEKTFDVSEEAKVECFMRISKLETASETDGGAITFMK